VLIAGQIAVSVPLLVGALLFLQTLRNLSAVDLGFDPSGVVEFQLNLPPVATGAAGAQPLSPDTARLMTTLLAAFEAIPGVSSATVVENPLVSGISSNTRVLVDGQIASMSMEAVGPRFFETMRVSLLSGRAISDRDVASAPPVAVVNRAAVDQVFHGQSPIGKILRVGTRNLAVVGVVDNAVYASLRRKPRPTFYDSYLQRPVVTISPYVNLRTVVIPASVIRPVTAIVAQLAPTVPVSNFKTENDQIAETTGQERVFSRLLTLFATFAIVLAGIGLYGLTSYAVARRTNEIGIRLALGAPRGQVRGMMLRQVVVLALAGLVAGVPLALLSARFVGTFVFGITPREPGTFVIVAVTMLSAAIAAGWLPARRAARLEPLSALRAE
jgi:predicted permease